MESSLQLPYDLVQEGLTYYFVNKDGIKYRAYFADISVYYPQFPNTYSFSFEPETPIKHPFISIYFKKTNPNKALLLQSFYDLLKTDLYQIGL